MKRRHSGFVTAILLLVFAGCTDDSDVTTQTVPFGERPLSVDSSNAPEPTPEQKVLTPTLRNVPGRVRLGNDLRYVVELLNETEDDIPLDQCPAFYQAWGESGTAYFGPGFLNCEDAPSVVPAGGAVRFRMVLELPEDNIEGQDFFAGTLSGIWVARARAPSQPSRRPWSSQKARVWK